jgi:hypothetical protein
MIFTGNQQADVVLDVDSANIWYEGFVCGCVPDLSSTERCTYYRM